MLASMLQVTPKVKQFSHILLPFRNKNVKIHSVRITARHLLIILAAATLLPGTGCLRYKRANPASEVAPRPEPRVKKSPYTINGVRYRPMGIAEALQYRETGEASIYEGAGSIGAIGEKLPYGGIYAAHRTLPLPSVVRVTSITTGKSCLVRVNDRGPFHRKRIIDLSPAAVRALGLIRRGVHQVIVETVSVGDGPNKRVAPQNN